LDNLLAHVGELPRWPGWAARVFAQAGLLGAALVLGRRNGDPRVIDALLVATFAVTLVSTAILFWRRRAAYLSDRVQRNLKSAAPAKGDAVLLERAQRERVAVGAGAARALQEHRRVVQAAAGAAAEVVLHAARDQRGARLVAHLGVGHRGHAAAPAAASGERE